MLGQSWPSEFVAADLTLAVPLNALAAACEGNEQVSSRSSLKRTPAPRVTKALGCPKQNASRPGTGLGVSAWGCATRTAPALRITGRGFS